MIKKNENLFSFQLSTRTGDAVSASYSAITEDNPILKS